MPFAFSPSVRTTSSLPPLGPEEALPRVIPAMADYFHSIGRPFYMKAVPERLVNPIVKALGIKAEVKSIWHLGL